MQMSSLNISLPKAMKDFVDNEVRLGAYSTSSEFVRALVRAEQKRRAQEELEAQLLAGVKSGKAIAAGPEYWMEKRRKFTAARSLKKPAK